MNRSGITKIMDADDLRAKAVAFEPCALKHDGGAFVILVLHAEA